MGRYAFSKEAIQGADSLIRNMKKVRVVKKSSLILEDKENYSSFSDFLQSENGKLLLDLR